MSRCSYIWAGSERDENKRNQCSEEIWEGSHEFCIFHDPSKEKDVKLFNQKLQEKLDKKDYNFRGYHFPEDVDFSGKNFEKDVYFTGANFQEVNFSGANFKYVDFSGANFKYVDFSGANFQEACFNGANFKETYFRRTNFNGYAGFSDVTFQDAIFNKTTFKEADFSEAVIKGNLEFNPEKIEKLNLRNSQFQSRGSITADLTNTLFHRAFIENVAFVNCNWPDDYIIYEEKNMNEEISYNQLETIYRDLKQNMQNHGDYDTAGELYYREMEMRRKQSKPFRPKWWGLNILRILCGYGEKPSRVIAVSLFIILIGANLFFFCGICRIVPEEVKIGNEHMDTTPTIIKFKYNEKKPGEIMKDFGYCTYYSVVTFTTLGYGDIYPMGYSCIFSSLEAFIGAFFIALFVVVFGRKMMR
jgi:hypothetical protein